MLRKSLHRRSGVVSPPKMLYPIECTLYRNKKECSVRIFKDPFSVEWVVGIVFLERKGNVVSSVTTGRLVFYTTDKIKFDGFEHFISDRCGRSVDRSYKTFFPEKNHQSGGKVGRRPTEGHC